MSTEITTGFLQEINRSLLLPEHEKIYWRENLGKMPLALIEYFYRYLKTQNNLVDSYFKQAIDSHPELVDEIKAKTNKIKQTLTKLQGSEDEQAAEEMIESELKQI